jgi:sugar/nucleoside kinase (ribokinase family)
MKTFDVLGIAGILPLDHTFVLTDRKLIRRALEVARAMSWSGLGQPQIGVSFESYQRSGGGRVANVLAYLGAAGEHITICGAIGDDEPGRLVIEDLRLHHVDVEYVRTCKGRHTRAVIVAAAIGASEQIHLKHRPHARFSPHMLGSLPAASVLLLGRANRSILGYIQNAKACGNAISKIAVHLRSWPWRRGEQEAHKQLLSVADTVVVWKPLLPHLNTCYGLDAKSPPEAFARQTGARLVVIYGGINDVQAVLNTSNHSVIPDRSEGVVIKDITGMMESFHGGLLSFFLKESKDSWPLSDVAFVKAALGYANEIAAICGSAIGARHFASLRDQELLRNHYATNLSKYDIVISFAGEDRVVAEKIADELKRSGIKVFYDKYVQADLWGKDLYSHLQEVYRRQGRYCLMLVSEHYKRKEFTNHERAAIQARAFEDNREYILPLRLDDVDLPGLLPTTAYVDFRKTPVETVVELLKKKLARDTIEGA